MAYNKKTWISNEIISKDALNNIENGIEAVEQSIPKKISQLENDSGYITEHLDLDDYALKSEIPVIPELPTKVSELENDLGYLTEDTMPLQTIPSNLSEFYNDTNFITLEDVPTCLITEEEKEEMNNRVNALEEVEHVSLEQYNALLNRIVLLEEALNDLKSEEPSAPEESDTPDVSNLEYIKLFDYGNIGNTDFGDLCITEKTTENNHNGWAEDSDLINYDFYINDYEAAWFSFSNSVDFSNYEKIMIRLDHDTTMKPLIGVSRNSEGNNYGYASELNMNKVEFIEVSSTNEDYSSKEYIFDVKNLIKTGNSGYLGFYFLRNNEGDGEITIYEIGVYKKK